MIKFSIIVPVYNSGKYLKKCIDSVLSQNYDNFEIILINDGSTDDSQKYCEEMVAICNKVVLFTQENKGQLPTRQKGISEATGDYCLFLDSDDWLEPETLKTLSVKCEAFNADILCYQFRIVYENKKVDFSPVLFPDETVFTEDKLPLIEIIMKSYYLNSVCNKAVKTDFAKSCLFDASKFSEIRQSEDLLQVLTLIEKAEKIVFINRPFYNYYIHGTSVSRRFKPDRYVDIHLVCLEVMDFGKRLGATQDMINMLYETFCEKIVSYLVSLYNSNLSLKDKRIILKNIRELSLYKAAGKAKKLSKKFSLMVKFPNLFNLYFKLKKQNRS